MAGSISFMPLQNVTHTKGGSDTNTKTLPKQPVDSGTGVQMNDNDDECIVTLTKPRSDEEHNLLPYMPAIFGTELPPCGLEPQVAYESLNARLRESWLKHRGRRSVVDICEDEKKALQKQESQYPPFSQKGPVKKRTPWRREMVFKFELQWIEYFASEAGRQIPELMTESEMMDRKKYSSVPKGLKLYIHKQHLLKLWDTWNEKKRVRVPSLPEELANAGNSDLADQPQNQDVEKLKTDVEDKDRISELSESSDILIIHRPGPENGSHDAHLWSQSNHD